MFVASSERALKVTMGWALAYALVTIAQTFRQQPVPESFERATQWLESHLRPGEGFAVDSRSHFEPIWRMSRDKRMVIVSAVWEQKPLAATEIVSWLNEQRVRFVVLDAASHKDAEPRYLFFDQMKFTPERRLTGSPPGGTRLVWAAPARDLQILEVVANTVQSNPGPAGRVVP